MWRSYIENHGRAPSKGYRARRKQCVIETLESRSLLAGDIAVLVWHDSNGNGNKDAGEDELPGWTIFLDVDDNGTLDAGEPSLVTDVDGEVLFEGIDDGDYVVREIMEPGWVVAPGSSDRVAVTVEDGKEEKVRFGNWVANAGDIVGVVWDDSDADGVRDAQEDGLAGWTVFLDIEDDGVPGPSEPITTTDASGNYSFLHLQPGAYDVNEIVQAGWQSSPGFPATRTAVVAVDQQTIVNFPNFVPVPGSISGIVWNDWDRDGHRDSDPVSGDFTEPGVGGIEVYVDFNSNGAADEGEPSAVSDATGSYMVTSVPMGLNRLRATLPSGWLLTSPAGGSHLFNLPNGGFLTGYEFGVREPQDASIKGTVFADSNRDGVRDPGERGLAGITVYFDLNNDGHLDAGEPHVVTMDDLFYTPSINETGDYSFTHLTSGSYLLRQIVPENQNATPAEQRERAVTLTPGESRSGVNFGNVFRANEIHGSLFEDLDGDRHRDLDEPAMPGVTVFIDDDRDDDLDESERRTVSGGDGRYEFRDLTPGAYVVRSVVSEGHVRTYPLTVGGILWPDGVSNPAVGNVSPTDITTSLLDGESYRTTVQITLPTTGGLTNLVDVFLLFDDTGSFTANSPIVRAAFPEIIAALQGALPGIDWGFGVGRLEEYGNYSGENSTGRPFILNQPVVALSTSGFAESIQAALDHMGPGFGGDTPETVFEALYQVVTGAGFDGNDNGSMLDSGAAGSMATQMNPGDSGDVPPFASFTPDPVALGLPAAGNLGGAGFRAGALPIILTATDTGFAYQPRGETTIVGVGGVTLPISALTGSSRATTPFDAGAGIQQTITGLNALGALVIGLGTNAEPSVDPRQGLEAIATLTGATNQTTTTIENGTPDAIAPGDPFYFQITSGFGPSVANGVIAAIQNAVTSVAVDITVKASDPRVHLINHTGVVQDVNAGGVASFDIEFVGEGIPHRFDLQFVREGTNVVLGSIPVVLGTPIPGDGYEFEDLEEGEHGEDVSFGSHHGSLPPNTAPSFVGGADEIMAEDAGSQTVVGWATSISPGAEIEAWQQVEFVVSNDNTALFATPPAISPSGTLTYAPAANASGTAVVTVVLRDNGGTDDGGVDASNPQTFTITVTPVNDPPQAASDAYEVYLNGSLVVPAQGVLGNDADVDDTSFSAVLETGPASGTLALNADGSFTYTPVTWFSGADSFTYRATDGTATSGLATATITVRWLTGDLNADGNVDRSDVALLVNGFGSTATRPGGDLDDDGIVGLTDVSLMSEHLGMQYPPPTPSAAASSSAVTRLGPRDAGETRNGTLVANRARHRRGTALSSAAVDAAVATGDPWSHRLQTTRMCRVAMR